MSKFATTVAICLALVMAACSSPPLVSPATPAPEENTLTAEPEASEPTPKPAISEMITTEPDPEPVSETVIDEPEIEVEASGIDTSAFGAAVASIEERAYLADVVVRARFVSAGNGVLNFQAIEYLKGSGDSTFTVKADTEGRSTQWDGVEAMLFLGFAEPAGAGGAVVHLEFADTTEFDYWGPEETAKRAKRYRGSRPDGYTVLSNNPVWLPAEDQGGASGAADGDDVIYIDAGLGVDPQGGASGAINHTVTLSEIRAAVAWVTGGEGIAGYNRCLRSGLSNHRFYRDDEAFHGPWPSHRFPANKLQAGSSRGTAIYSEENDEYQAQWSEYGYDNYVFDGPYADLFEVDITDEDGQPLTGYTVDIVTARPLPAGEYKLDFTWQSAYWVPCDYVTYTNQHSFMVTVTGLDYTLHEMLFDPTDTGGSLSPTSFAGNDGSAATINGLTYKDGKIKLDVTPPAAVTGQFIEIIELDGTVSRQLPVDRATTEGTVLSWTVDHAPWETGDKLMVRISSAAIPPGDVQARSDAPGEVTVTWTDNPYTSRYFIFLDDPGNRYSYTAEFDAPATSYTFTGIENAASYTATVVAIIDVGHDGASRDAVATSNAVQVSVE